MGAAFTGVGNAIIKDVYGQQGVGRIIAFIQTGMAIAPTISPIIGAHLTTWFSWRSVFIFLSVYALLFVLGLLFKLPETHSAEKRAITQDIRLQSILHFLLSHGKFVSFILI